MPGIRSVATLSKVHESTSRSCLGSLVRSQHMLALLLVGLFVVPRGGFADTIVVEADGPEMYVSETVPQGIKDGPSLEVVAPGRATLVWSGNRSTDTRVSSIRERTLIHAVAP